MSNEPLHTHYSLIAFVRQGSLSQILSQMCKPPYLDSIHPPSPQEYINQPHNTDSQFLYYIIRVLYYKVTSGWDYVSSKLP